MEECMLHFTVKFADYVVLQAKHCVKLYWAIKKYIRNSGFWSGIFSQIPIACSGILKIPSGSTPCPRGFSKSPPGSGDLGENSLSKTRISYIYSVIYLGNTKLPSIGDIGINNFHYIFHMTDEIGISVYCVFTAYLYKNSTIWLLPMILF